MGGGALTPPRKSGAEPQKGLIVHRHFYGFRSADDPNRVFSVALEDVVAISGVLESGVSDDGATWLHLTSGAVLRVTDSIKHVKDALKSYDLVALYE
jgi:hypothetical protein